MQAGGDTPDMKTLQERMKNAYETVLYCADSTWSSEPNEIQKACQKLLEKEVMTKLSNLEESNWMTTHQNPEDEMNKPSTSTQRCPPDGGDKDFDSRDQTCSDNALIKSMLPESPFMRVNSRAEYILKSNIVQYTVKAIWDDQLKPPVLFANYTPPPVDKEKNHPSCLIPVPILPNGTLPNGNVTYYVFGKKYRTQQLMEMLEQQQLLKYFYEQKINNDLNNNTKDDPTKYSAVKRQNPSDDCEKNKKCLLPKDHISFTDKEEIGNEVEDLLMEVFRFIFTESEDTAKEPTIPVQTTPNPRESPRCKGNPSGIPDLSPNRNREMKFDNFSKEKKPKCSKKQKKEERWKMQEEKKRQKKQKKIEKKQQNTPIKIKQDPENISEVSSFSSEQKARHKSKPEVQPMKEAYKTKETPERITEPLLVNQTNVNEAKTILEVVHEELHNEERRRNRRQRLHTKNLKSKKHIGKTTDKSDTDNETGVQPSPDEENLRWSIIFNIVCSCSCVFYFCYFAYGLLTINVFEK